MAGNAPKARVSDDSDYGLPVFAVVAIVLLFSAAFVVFMLVQKNGGETFSEVFFKLDSVPKEVFSGKAFSFAFSVNNREGQTVRYDFEVLSGGKTLDFGSFSVASGALKTREVSIALDRQGNQKVSVRVSYDSGGKKSQEIFFWADVA